MLEVKILSTSQEERTPTLQHCLYRSFSQNAPLKKVKQFILLLQREKEKRKEKTVYGYEFFSSRESRVQINGFLPKRKGEGRENWCTGWGWVVMGGWDGNL